MVLIQCHGMSSWVRGCNVCIPGEVASIISTIYSAILIIVPLLLILSGMATMAMAVTKQKEEEIKKAQQLLVKKIVAGIIAFLLLTITRFLINTISDDSDKTSIVNCFDALLNYDEASVCTGANCGSSGDSPANTYATFNNNCKDQATTGAVGSIDTNGKLSNNFKCFTTDEVNCKCTENPLDIPYNDNGCKCARMTQYDGNYVRIEVNGYPNK